jgi:hypothetical protein
MEKIEGNQRMIRVNNGQVEEEEEEGIERKDRKYEADE